NAGPMTHRVTHFCSGVNWTAVDIHAQKTPQFAGFFADAWTDLDIPGRLRGGPSRIRTWNQGIRFGRGFPPGADYLFALRRGRGPGRMGRGTLEPVIKGTAAPR